MKNLKGNTPASQDFKHVIHLDEKILKPEDRTKSGSLVGSRVSTVDAREGLRPNGLLKSLVGKPRIYDLKGNLLAEEENLVVLKGREYLAQLVANMAPVGASHCGSQTPIGATPTACDYGKYIITHFAVGTGGTNGDCPPVANGPYDNDIGLAEPRELFPVTGEESAYLRIVDGGPPVLKDITHSGGSIEVTSEQHTINLDLNGGEVVEAYTAIRYTMYINPGESTQDPNGGPNSFPFRFNEAGLYAVKQDSNGNALDENDAIITDDRAAKHLLFARFTTLDKYLEEADGIMIEWYILV